MQIKIDRSIYSDSCISKAVYALSSRYAIARSSDGSYEVLTIHGIADDDADARHAILATLNDYKLRQIVDDETRDIRTILYAKAFSDCDDDIENV